MEQKDHQAQDAPSPIPVPRRNSSQAYLMQQDGKKSMKSVFMSKQKLKGLTSSPADSTFSPISRQFLRRDEKRGIMKKTNIQRVIAERKKSLNNDGKCKFFESKINGHNGASSKHEHVMYENTGTTHTLVSSPFPPHRQGLSIGKQTIFIICTHIPAHRVPLFIEISII